VTILDDITKQAQESLALADGATKKPWRFGMHAQGTRHVVDGQGYMFCQVDDDGNGRLIVHASTALPDLANAWLAVQEALDEVAISDPHWAESFSSAIRAAILRRLSK
jgi:hypothetical protein